MPALACGVAVGLLVGLLGTAVHLLTVSLVGVRVPFGLPLALALLATSQVALGLAGPAARRASALGWTTAVVIVLMGRPEGDYALLLTSGRTQLWLLAGLVTAGWALLSGRDEVRVGR